MLEGWITLGALGLFTTITVVFLSYYVRPEVSWLTYLSCWIGISLALSCIVALPLDVVVTSQYPPEQTQGVSDGMYWGWRLLYWTVFALCWVVFQVMSEYEVVGEFTMGKRLRRALIRLSFFWAFLLVVGLAGLIYFLIQFKSLSRMTSYLIALSNVWGLLQIVLLMGYGLVAVPRFFWLKSRPIGDRSGELARCYIEAAHLWQVREEGAFDCMELLAEVRAADQSVGAASDQRANVDKIVAASSNLSRRFWLEGAGAAAAVHTRRPIRNSASARSNLGNGSAEGRGVFAGFSGFFRSSVEMSEGAPGRGGDAEAGVEENEPVSVSAAAAATTLVYEEEKTLVNLHSKVKKVIGNFNRVQCRWDRLVSKCIVLEKWLALEEGQTGGLGEIWSADLADPSGRLEGEDRFPPMPSSSSSSSSSSAVPVNGDHPPDSARSTEAPPPSSRQLRGGEGGSSSLSVSARSIETGAGPEVALLDGRGGSADGLEEEMDEEARATYCPCLPPRVVSFIRRLGRGCSRQCLYLNGRVRRYLSLFIWACTTALSIAVIEAQVAILSGFPRLSLFYLILWLADYSVEPPESEAAVHGPAQRLGLLFVCSLLLAYLVCCTFWGLFQLKLAGWYGLYPRKCTDGASLLFFTNFVCRLAAPLCFHFLDLGGIGKAGNKKPEGGGSGRDGQVEFQQFYGQIDVVPILGLWVNLYLPVVVVVVALVNLLNLWNRLADLLGLQSLEFGLILTEGSLAEGRERVQTAIQQRRREQRTRRENRASSLQRIGGSIGPLLSGRGGSIGAAWGEVGGGGGRTVEASIGDPPGGAVAGPTTKHPSVSGKSVNGGINGDSRGGSSGSANSNNHHGERKLDFGRM